MEIPLTIICSIALWCVGTVVFDTVHRLLHVMLGTRTELLQAVAGSR